VTLVELGFVIVGRRSELGELLFEIEAVMIEFFRVHRAKLRKRMMRMTMIRVVSHP